ncbi:MAG: hypothetical protein ABSD97_06825 [Acidimicrobiales bacterium]
MDFVLRSSAQRFGLPLVLATTALVILTCSGFTPSARPSARADTTSSVLASAKAAIAKQTGARLSLTVTSSSSSSTEKVTRDSGVTEGLETIAVGAATATIKATPSYAYISGSSSGLTEIFGLSAAQAKKVGKHWVSFKAGTSEYSGFKSDVTMSSVDSVLPEAKGTKTSMADANGTKVYVLTWTIAATSSTPKTSNTLTISAVGAALPIKETASDTSGDHETLLLSKWGEHVSVSAPPAASTISYTQVTG